MQTSCPLLLQGTMSNPEFLKVDQERRALLLQGCSCIESACGFWTEMQSDSDDDDEDEAEVVEGCALALIPTMLAECSGAIGEVTEAVESIQETYQGTQKILELGAFAAAAHFGVDINATVAEAQAMASGHGQSPPLEETEA